ncbi:helix-turn-helix domain-containing protein [Nocardiopsis alborubida]|uniref:Helix-turn-helix domain-containing protein n=1 Tax=Nocardiopsis alborubida TaxID=146802 RepID=A0A7X6RRV6_9ACTN|nr:helix-turn-helix domain-containing protein [Nocardiopsis alborubida]NKY99641.1 helix-turn-helix domain-containing protein [Nocardiopsis alborubida]
MVRSSVLGRAPRIEPRGEDRWITEKVVSFTGTSGARLLLRTADGSELALPESLVRILVASANELSEGHAVTVLASETCLTPAEAAELLGLSRPFVVRLLDAGEIPSERLPDSRHRVVRLEDVLEFQARRERRRAGRRRIAEAVESADLPY